MRPRRVNRFRSRYRPAVGEQKFQKGDVIGDFTIIEYRGHSSINKRTAEQMSKAQHWYRCQCSCGTKEYRSQQELIDVRRNQCCFECRADPKRRSKYGTQSKPS